MTAVRIATRGSALALVQARWVARRVEERLGADTALVEVRTSGDRLQDVSLARLGGKGLFVKEIEEALLEGRADLAVHSAKDLPARIPDALVLAAFPERADPRDALVVADVSRGARLADLPPGATVGTGSVRRGAQLRARRPDLDIVPLRGNVTTRLDRLDAGGFDAVLLACAGLERLGLAERIHERLSPEVLLPAVGQGVLAIEARAADPLVRDLAALDHAETAAAIAAERAFLAHLEGDCSVPLAALCEPRGVGHWRMRGLVASLDGSRIARAEAAGGDPLALGRSVAEQVLARGGADILAELRAAAAP
jgi:hydroxymethylbilane synthase